MVHYGQLVYSQLLCLVAQVLCSSCVLCKAGVILLWVSAAATAVQAH
jgi:hypothetical protein